MIRKSALAGGEGIPRRWPPEKFHLRLRNPHPPRPAFIGRRRRGADGELNLFNRFFSRPSYYKAERVERRAGLGPRRIKFIFSTYMRR